jgi:hypothetical protein
MSLSGSEVITVDELEKRLQKGSKLYLADGPPFCGMFEQHFTEGSREEHLYDQPVAAILETHSVVSAVWVIIEKMIVRHYNLHSGGVVCDDNILSGWLVRGGYLIDSEPHFFLARNSYFGRPLYVSFNNWMRLQGISRTDFEGLNTVKYEGLRYCGYLMKNLSSPEI